MFTYCSVRARAWVRWCLKSASASLGESSSRWFQSPGGGADRERLRDSCAVQYLMRANKTRVCYEVVEFCWSNQFGLMEGVSFSFLSLNASIVSGVSHLARVCLVLQNLHNCLD